MIKFFKLFSGKKSYCPPERCVPTINRQSFVDYLLYHGEYRLATHQLIRYYCICAPLTDGIDMVGQAIAAIKPMVYDPDKKEFLPDHPANEILTTPSLNNNHIEFMKQYANFFNIIGDSYIIMNSLHNENSIPRQMAIIPPQNVNINLDGHGGVESYSVTIHSDLKTYKKKIDINRGERFISESNSVVSELFHSKTFNPTSNGFNIRGKSKLSAVYYEVEQYIASSIHNLSVLKRGSTLSGVFTTEANLNDDEFSKLKAEADEYYSGEGNAGRPLVLDKGLVFSTTQQSNKDMDFLELKKEVKTMVYQRLNIPIPLISADTMTMGNYETAKVSFYDDAVLPIIDRLYADMTAFIMPRYPNSENLKIWYNISDIPALESRKVDNIVKTNTLGTFTVNELRAQLGFKRLEVGGDTLYQASNLVPYARDTEANKDPIETLPPDDGKKKPTNGKK